MKNPRRARTRSRATPLKTPSDAIDFAHQQGVDAVVRPTTPEHASPVPDGEPGHDAAEAGVTSWSEVESARDTARDSALDEAVDAASHPADASVRYRFPKRGGSAFKLGLWAAGAGAGWMILRQWPGVRRWFGRKAR
jgi:hypothetical protein